MDLVYRAIFPIGLITIFNYTDINSPSVLSLITNGFLILGGFWYFKDVIWKHFYEGFKDAQSDSVRWTPKFEPIAKLSLLSRGEVLKPNQN